MGVVSDRWGRSTGLLSGVIGPICVPMRGIAVHVILRFLQVRASGCLCGGTRHARPRVHEDGCGAVASLPQPMDP
ncbi:hypothetical protein GS506_08080 [Rhodococcus hoagii]|nr:hypothetical protein [Prescottella equi]